MRHSKVPREDPTIRRCFFRLRLQILWPFQNVNTDATCGFAYITVFLEKLYLVAKICCIIIKSFPLHEYPAFTRLKTKAEDRELIKLHQMLSGLLPYTSITGDWKQQKKTEGTEKWKWKFFNYFSQLLTNTISSFSPNRALADLSDSVRQHAMN